MDNQQLTAAFKEVFESEPAVIVHAPGRVNLIGEHTDYNQGFVFPAAINFGTWIAARPREDRNVNVTALDYGHQANQFSLDDIQHDKTMPWSEYVRGVMSVLITRFPDVKGANMVITGNVPQGAGLSSSASLEVALLKAMTELYGLPLEGVQAALMGQKAENTFVGCSCGIMDQLISAMGKQGNAMLLDCESLTFKHSPMPATHEIVIINSNIKRGLVDSEYNVRREQCEQAASVMGVSSLRHATLDMLQNAKADMTDAVYRRAKHILTENVRTADMSEAMAKGDIGAISRAMSASHVSMRDDFEITVPYIDYLVEIVDQVIGLEGGVRMTGGGFGGCIVALVRHEQVEDVRRQVETLYPEKTGLSPDIYTCEASNGAFAGN